MTLEEWERVRFYILLLGGFCTVAAMVISAYLAIERPGIQITF